MKNVIRLLVLLFLTTSVFADESDMFKLLKCPDFKTGVYKVEQYSNDIIAFVSSEMRIYSSPSSCEKYQIIGKNITSDFRDSYVKMEERNLSFYKKGQSLWTCPINDSLLSNSFFIVNSKLVAFSPKKYSPDKHASAKRKIFTIDDKCNVNLVIDSLFIESWQGGLRSNMSYLATVSSKGKKYYLALIDSSDGHIKGIFETSSNMNLSMDNKVYYIGKKELMKDSVAKDEMVQSKIEYQFNYYKTHPLPLEIIFICGNHVCSRNQKTNEISLIE